MRNGRWIGVVVLAAMAGGQAVAQQARPDEPVFVALYERGPAFVTGKDVPEQPHFRDHVEYLRARGERIIAGGPFPPKLADQVVGLVVFQAADARDAEEWIALDPGVVIGVFKASVRQWRVTSIRRFELTQAPPQK